MTYLADKGLDQSTLTDIFAPKPFGDLRRNLWRYLIYNSISNGHAYGEGHVLVEDVQDLSIPMLLSSKVIQFLPMFESYTYFFLYILFIFWCTWSLKREEANSLNMIRQNMDIALQMCFECYMLTAPHQMVRYRIILVGANQSPTASNFLQNWYSNWYNWRIVNGTIRKNTLWGAKNQ